MELNGIAFAMIGLVYGLCHWIFFCSGTKEGPAWWRKKTLPEEMVPEQPIGAMGSLVAGISLFQRSPDFRELKRLAASTRVFKM